MKVSNFLRGSAVASVLLLTGCSGLSAEVAEDREQLRNDQEKLGVALAPVQETLLAVGSVSLTETSEALDPTMAELTKVSDVWFDHADGWKFPDTAADGAPSQGAVDDFTAALETYLANLEDITAMVDECVQYEDETACLSEYAGQFEGWDADEQALVAAESTMVDQANKQ